MEDKFKKWNRWLDEIRADIEGIAGHRGIFRRMRAGVDKGRDRRDAYRFIEFLDSSYVALALMGIRRQVKIHKDSISLARLLREICAAPSLLSRKRFAAAREAAVTAEDYFDAFAGGGEEHVDPARVKKDLDDLKRRACELERYADRAIAHHDKRKPAAAPDFADVDSCLDFLEGLFRKYYLLFRAGEGSTGFIEK